jgi:hypothetical protein
VTQTIRQLPPPRLEDLEEAAREISGSFNRRTFAFLDSRGAWRDNPKSIRDRASHEALFALANATDEERHLFLESAWLSLADKTVWPAAKKIKVALLARRERKQRLRFASEALVDRELTRALSASGLSCGQTSFLILLDVAVWVIGLMVLETNSRCFVPEWDEEGKARKSACLKQHLSEERFLDGIFSPNEKKAVQAAVQKFRNTSENFLNPISALLAEEERFNQAISGLLQKAATPELREEALSLIAEKIQPPQGIVTNTSPALLRPCLGLLLDLKIDPESGVPYYASVVLSILSDTRAARDLLRALRLRPASQTKIRENIIYALGNIREGRAAGDIASVLELPDEIPFSAGAGEKSYHPLIEQKEEAIWALGKMGLDAIPAIPVLAAGADHPALELRTYLAWTLGEIGQAQKESLGGVSADVVIGLLKLLKTKNKQVFEESASALKKIGMPDFVHALYLYHVGAISILGLKPAQRGLYELSETLHYLLRTKKRTIMAVNGDSGTGKTYFCQAIMDGFGGVRPDDILYLMRDRRRGQKVFNRLLGLSWLKKYIDPAYYHDGAAWEAEDDPDAYFGRFLAEHADKKLIILDGARDSLYFQKVIDTFYARGELDVEVNFRANFSTRRLNLEAREMALESVRTHLEFLEEPTLEDTLFYQEGIVVLYDLDNSIGSRLAAPEIKELFETPRIDSWGDLIRLGDFSEEAREMHWRDEEWSQRDIRPSVRRHGWEEAQAGAFAPGERNFKAAPNEGLTGGPHLLQTIDLGELLANRIRFYAQEQIAGISQDGRVFILTFLNNRVFETRLDDVSGIALLGRDIYVVGNQKELVRVSFERNESAVAAKTISPIQKIAAVPRERIITGHADGSVRIWNRAERTVTVLEGDGDPVTALAADGSGRVYAAGKSGRIKRWDSDSGGLLIIEGAGGYAALLRPYPGGKILGVFNAVDSRTGSRSFFGVLDFDALAIRVSSADLPQGIACASVYFDGRVIAGLACEEGQPAPAKNLIVVSGAPGSTSGAGREVSPAYQELGAHGLEISDCLTIGPKIITSGLETDGRPSLRVWGTEFFVRMELGKLAIRPASR